MGLHAQAWAGQKLLIYGKTPLIPMRIEQAIAAVSPSNEIILESFEDYDLAFDFCKQQKSVGFIFLLENCGAIPADQVFAQLAKPYSEKGWPCFGCLIYEGTETLAGYRAKDRCSQLLSYISLSDLLEKSRTANTVTQLWAHYIEAFETTVLPDSMQQTLYALARPHLSLNSQHFSDRVSTLLAADLNISWLELIALRWHPIVVAARLSNRDAIEANVTLLSICTLAETMLPSNDLNTILDSKLPLCARISAITSILDKARHSGELQQLLKVISTQSRPGASALIRLLARKREEVLRIASEEVVSSSRRQAV